MTSPTGYSRAQIILHWLTAATVLVAFFSHDAMEEAARLVWRTGGEAHPTVHTIAGFLTFFLVVARLILRGRRGAPEPVGVGLAKQAAIWGHRLLYALLIAVPMLGVLTWIGGFRGLSDAHGTLGKAMMLVALGHAAVAIWHQFGKKDGTLMRMFRPDTSA